MAQLLEQLAELIQNIILTFNYPGIFGITFIETVFPPIPSELVMPFAGFEVAAGQLNLIGVLLAGTLGSTLGALVLYYIGAWADERIIRSFVRRYGRWFLLSEDDIDRALKVFGRYGEAVIFFGRMMPIIRSLISIPAGMNRMPLPRFLLFTALGTGAWIAFLTIAGVVLGENWQQILDVIDRYEDIIIIGLVIVLIVFVVWKLRARLRGSRPATATAEETAAE